MRIRFCAAVVVLLAVVGCKTLPPVGASATFEFPFVGDYDVVNRTEFYWSDTYVTNNATVYQNALSGPLACIAASAYGCRLFMDVRSLMDLGVPPERLMRVYEDNGELTHKDPKYGRDVVGFTIGSRQTELPDEDFDIVFVAVRGTFGLEEWLSNVNMANAWGAQAELDMETLPKYHEGFYKAAQFVRDALVQYAREHKIDLKTAKILVTGHSRGAATANLLGKMLDDAAGGPTDSPLADVKRENVYVYTFATPNVTIRSAPDARDEKYHNIFNVVSPEDVVPLVPIEAWDGTRYGRTLVLKCWSTIFWGGSYLQPGYVGMKNNFKDICGYEYWHMFGGTYFVDKVPAFLKRIAPTVGHLYYVKPEMRADGNTTCIHSWFEMIFWKNMVSSSDPNRHRSMMSDVTRFANAYSQLTDELPFESHERYLDHKLRFRRPLDEGGSFDPDGRDFSRQPGIMDIVWRLTCMHAPLTYISWIKAADDHDPDLVFENWDEFEAPEED